MVLKRLYGHYLRSYEEIKKIVKFRKFKSDFPRGKLVENFLMEEPSPPLRNLVVFKKMVTKNNDFSRKNPLDVTHILRSCNPNPYLTLSLRGSAIQHLHNEARSAEM